jgi:hypothetical protein
MFPRPWTRWSRRAIASALAPLAGLVVAGLVVWPGVAGAQGKGRGNGRVTALLGGDVPRESCLDRMQSLESPFTLADGEWEWSVGLAEGGAARIDTVRMRSASGFPVEVGRGFGRSLDVTLTLQPYEYLGIDPGPLSDLGSAQGLGASTLRLRARLTADPAARLQSGVALWSRVPGSRNSPDTQVLETGVTVPVAVRLGTATVLGASAGVESVGGILSDGRFMDGTAALGVSHDIGDALGLWGEVVGVWYGESVIGHLVSADAGVSLDVLGRVEATLGVAAGRGGGAWDSGVKVAIHVHS